MTRRALIIGAGMGGLASALLLAHAGLEVTVLEMGDQPGGKAGEVVLDGVRCDTGPSLLTMVDVLDDLFSRVGLQRQAYLSLRRLEPAFRYLYPDGTSLDIHHDLEQTRQSVRQTLGPEAAADLDAFLAYAARIWEASAPAFVYGDAPSPRRLAGMDLKTLAGMRHIDAFSTMWAAICRQVRDPRLRWMLARYATYNGSDVRRCPATLNCITHVELALGGYGVEGGMHQIALALMRAAASFGARFLFGQQVTSLQTRAGRVHQVLTAQDQAFDADLIVCNADARHLYGDLLEPARPGDRDYAPSMSGWNAILRATRHRARSQASHTVLFPEDYLDEFAAIFDRHQLPAQPTVYACNQALAHGTPAWDDADPLFVMVNAPALQPGTPDIDSDAIEALVLARLTRAGLIAPGDPVLWRRDPAGLASRFPGSLGSIYGASSNSKFAAFRRPANRDARLTNLYLASGSAHPGGGVPLCLLSGCAAARAVLQDT